MSYHYHICGWVARLGNHLLQFSHGIYLAEKYKGVCTYREHEIIETKTFDFSNGAQPEKFFDETFWELQTKYNPTNEDYSKDLHQERPRILKEYILPIFKPYQKIDLEYDMVINLRGGTDIFNDRGSPPQYVQAPLSYFLHILERENPKKVLIVSEDNIHNPVLEKLKETKYNIEVHSENSREVDCNEILNAKVFVIGGISPCSLVLAQMSPNVQKIYYPEFEYGWNLPEDQLWRRDHWYHYGNMLGTMDAEVVPIKFEDYIEIGQWGDYTLEEKHQIMLNYPLDKVYGTSRNK